MGTPGPTRTHVHPGSQHCFPGAVHPVALIPLLVTSWNRVARHPRKTLQPLWGSTACQPLQPGPLVRTQVGGANAQMEE